MAIKKKKTTLIWQTIKWLALPLLWMGFIFFLSAQPVLPGPKVMWGDFLFKKGAHMFVYAMLYLWWLIFFKKYEELSGKKVENKWWWCLVLVFLYALTDEYHQSFILGRTATARDVGFDTLGGLTAMLWAYRVI